MKTIHSTIGGFAGAIALNVVHQSLKQFIDEAPAVDLVGEQALNKGLKKVGVKPLRGDKLFLSTLAADVASNAIYYSLIGFGSRKNTLTRGVGYGLAAGVGALALTKPMGLNDRPITKSTTTKLLTVGYYLLGGIVTAVTINALSKRKRTKNTPLVKNTSLVDEDDLPVIGNS